jgi:tRNA pseudouridine38-40 synthase
VTTRLDLEYDGSGFAGWARQPGLRSVEDELQRALATVLQEPGIVLTVAGRTDTGVHAWGQVVSYPHEAVDPRRLNGLLPADVAVLASTPQAAAFDARGDAVSRTYCYRVLNRPERSALERDRALWWARPLDRAALHACAAALVGCPDLTAFTPSETRHQHFRRRVLSAEWRERGDVLEFWITAESFLRHMNRILVGTMLDAAIGNRTTEAFAALLEGAPRSAAAQTAPAHGLALASVAY